MHFYPNQVFHIYNQGNNGRQLFYTPENYLFFLWKMRAYLLPFGDLVAYCLMPNHFHWQFFVKTVEVEPISLWRHVDHVEQIRRVAKYGSNALPVKRDRRVAKKEKKANLNYAIGILQRSYSRAINRDRNWFGSLFRKHCKAKDGWIDEFVTLRKTNGKFDYRFWPGTDYVRQCFAYIHENPTKAGLVKKSTDWIYSSARDYAGTRKGSLCNVELGKKLIGMP